MYYYKYEEKNSVSVPEPFHRLITPMFMGGTEESELAGFSIHMTEWPKGCTIDEHDHPDSTEAMMCIAGHGKALCGDTEYDLVPGSMIVATPGVRHKITNTGDELLRCVCVFHPPISEEALVGRAKAAADGAQKEQGAT